MKFNCVGEEANIIIMDMRARVLRKDITNMYEMHLKIIELIENTGKCSQISTKLETDKR